ncbi:MAG: protein kinase [Kordiimonadaceae bacterium]|nr:protein kinase [Kordiimonadaceae bacterium]
MDRIGKYRVLNELGRGGFGAVYLCEDNLKQKVAIKVFDPANRNTAGTETKADDAELKQRFVSEAIILRKLSSSPYIVDLYDFDESDEGLPYYVMPYLEQSLVDEIGRDIFSASGQEEISPEELPRRLPVDRALQVLTQILEAMRAVHSQGLVHRDLKPANILFDKKGPTGKVQVCDFGIAKLPDTQHSQSGVGMGSILYMSKEQRESAKHVTASSDIYSIGVIAYRMLTGTLPDGRYEDPIAYAPSIGQSLNGLILSAMDVDPAKRPGDAAQFLKELKLATSSIESRDAEDATGTWIEQSESSIRDNLKPIRDKIVEELLEHGEVRDETRKRLEPSAMVADLDAEGLQNLIDVTAVEHDETIRPIRNFLRAVNKSIEESSLTDEIRDGLFIAGESIGWNRDKVEAVLASKMPDSIITANPSQEFPESEAKAAEPLGQDQPEVVGAKSSSKDETLDTGSTVAPTPILMLGSILFAAVVGYSPIVSGTISSVGELKYQEVVAAMDYITFASVLPLPFIIWGIYRLSVRTIVLASQFAFGLSLLCVGALYQGPDQLPFLYTLMAFAGAGVGTVATTFAIIISFRNNPGLSLGLVGLAYIAGQMLTGFTPDLFSHGKQLAFFMLGAFQLIIVLPVFWVCFKPADVQEEEPKPTLQETLLQLIRKPAVWSALFAIMILTYVVFRMPSELVALGVSTEVWRDSYLLSASVGALLFGWMMDQMRINIVLAFMCALAAIGLQSLTFPNAHLLSVALIGSLGVAVTFVSSMLVLRHFTLNQFLVVVILFVSVRSIGTRFFDTAWDIPLSVLVALCVIAAIATYFGTQETDHAVEEDAAQQESY